jgi:arsenate reductase-like glutaredoxin family protein
VGQLQKMTKAEILKYVFIFFKEYAMHSEDFRDWLKKIGVKAEDLTRDAYEKLKAEKAKMDTETRRKCRLFWATVSVVTFFIGLGLGHLFF